MYQTSGPFLHATADASGDFIFTWCRSAAPMSSRCSPTAPGRRCRSGDGLTRAPGERHRPGPGPISPSSSFPPGVGATRGPLPGYDWSGHGRGFEARPRPRRMPARPARTGDCRVRGRHPAVPGCFLAAVDAGPLGGADVGGGLRGRAGGRRSRRPPDRPPRLRRLRTRERSRRRSRPAAWSALRNRDLELVRAGAGRLLPARRGAGVPGHAGGGAG